MKRFTCPHCRCCQNIAAVINGTTVCRYCRRWSKVAKPRTRLLAERQTGTKLVAEARKQLD